MKKSEPSLAAAAIEEEKKIVLSYQRQIPINVEHPELFGSFLADQTLSILQESLNLFLKIRSAKSK